MTKHLRFLFVMLLTMIWSAGWAQTTIWSEDWSGWKSGTQPQNMKYDNVVYDNSNTGTKTYTDYNNAEGVVPELLIKSGDTWTVTIKDLKGCSGTFKLEYKSNKSLKVTENSKKVNLSNSGKLYTGTFDVVVGTTQLVLRFKASSNARIDDVVLTATSASDTKTATNVSFGTNSNKTFTFTEGKYSDDTFTTPTATEQDNIAGTIKYSSDNTAAISVDASTGALTFKGYGKATITATFTPNDTEKYAESTDSYIVENKSDVVVFDGADNAFEKMTQYSGSNTTIKDQTIVDANGTEYVFRTNGGKMGSCIQLRSKTGKITSPTFDNFSNGYTVIITYGCGGKGYPTLSADGNSVKVEQKGDVGSGKGVEAKLLVSNSNAFTFACGDNYVKISKIEIVPNKVGVTLDESATNTIEVKTGVNVTLKRSMVANEWNTICLPFDVTAEQATVAFGEGVKIAQLDDTSTGNILNFVDMSNYGMEAAVPYLIKPTVAATTEEYSFKGVEIKEAAVTPTKVKTNGNLYFNGIYNKMDVTTDASSGYYAAFLGANNTIFKAKAGGTMKGFRAYFAIPKSASASALRVVIDGTATSIKNIDSEVVESNAPVYNLQGQRVDGNNLTPGIYVKAGKKFVVK